MLFADSWVILLYVYSKDRPELSLSHVLFLALYSLKICSLLHSLLPGRIPPIRGHDRVQGGGPAERQGWGEGWDLDGATRGGGASAKMLLWPLRCRLRQLSRHFPQV